MPSSKLVVASLLAVTATLATGCRDDGRQLSPAAEVPVSLLTVPPSASPEALPLQVHIPGVADGSVIGPEITCDGTPPVPLELVISGTSGATAELAVTVVDQDADGYVHWAVGGIDPGTVELDSLRLPLGAVEARSTGGSVGWEPPCPPPGAPAHTYVITVSAMVEPIGLVADLDGATAVGVIATAAVETDTFSFRYARSGS